MRKPRFLPLNIPIAPILEHYGADTHYQRGGWQAIKCPFHDDRNASAAVNYTINRFQCHAGCTDRAEDTVGLIQHRELLDFRAAREEASRIAGTGDEGVRRLSRPRSTVFDGAWNTG